nr:hypothetical protein GCM10020092_023900 [Actinoplanes digitatis]
MPLGDSITLGTGTPARDGYRKGLAHRLLLGGMQINFVGSQSNGSGSDPQHEGHGGYNIDELAAEADDWLAQARPDVVLLHAGTNSIKEGVGARATAAKLSALIDQVRAARPEAYIFVAQITASRVSKERADGRAYNELIPGLVAKKNDPKITVVDQSSVGGIDLHDLRHPNAFGYSKMAYNWYASMAKVFQLARRRGTQPVQGQVVLPVPGRRDRRTRRQAPRDRVPHVEAAHRHDEGRRRAAAGSRLADAAHGQAELPRGGRRQDADAYPAGEEVDRSAQPAQGLGRTSGRGGPTGHPCLLWVGVT